VIERFLKPHYLFRPSQAVRRLIQVVSRSLPESAMVTLPWGLPLRVDATEDIGRAIWQLGLYDLAVSEALWRLLDPGALALDVGANIGFMTNLMAWRSGPCGRVLAFEPHPEVFRSLAENVERLSRHPSVAPIELHDSALGERIGYAYLECGEQFARNHGTARLTGRESSLRVATTTLDKTLAGRIAAVVKIDVEGAELSILHGAIGAIREGHIRSFVYEAYPKESQGLAELLQAHGYQVFGLGRNLRGLILSPPDQAPHLPGYEAPSFLATLDPDSVLPRMRPRGWRVL
jgi:FkbM family methyltransferase